MRIIILAIVVVVSSAASAFAQASPPAQKCPVGTVSLPDAGGQYSCVPLPVPKKK